MRTSSYSAPHNRQLRPQRYNLGPNGAILTALNLFTTKFDQVLDLVEKRAESVECVFCVVLAPRLGAQHPSTQLCDR